MNDNFPKRNIFCRTGPGDVCGNPGNCKNSGKQLRNVKTFGKRGQDLDGPVLFWISYK